MLTITKQEIELNAHVSSKEEAIRAVGAILVNAGYIDPAYIESMLGRETQANTFLGCGVAIPHGMPKDRGLIHKTGVAVLQVPSGVTWSGTDKATLVVGIAAQSDEHLQILANLTGVLGDPKLAARLSETGNVDDIIHTLMNGVPSDDTLIKPLIGEASHNVTIINSTGLHARPGTVIVRIAQKYESEIRIAFDSKIADAKSLASILSLGVPGNSTVRVFAAGSDQAEAITDLVAAIDAGLEEEDEAETTAHSAPKWESGEELSRITGVQASPGFVIAPVFQLRRTGSVALQTNTESVSEIARFNSALDNARAELREMQKTVTESIGKHEAAIFAAQEALLEDPELTDQTRLRIDQGDSAETAWARAIATKVAELSAIQNELIAARAADFQDIGQRVLRLLNPATDPLNSLPDYPIILLADDLMPSETARLDTAIVVGICTSGGGPRAHTAIIARSLDIPAVVAMGDALLNIANDSRCILDADAGCLYTTTTEDALLSAQKHERLVVAMKQTDYNTRFLPAYTSDGNGRVEILANIGKASDVDDALSSGAEGVGLLRTEFLFLERTVAPTENEQYDALVGMIRTLDGLPLIVRTLDIGGDKVVPYLDLPHEDNPFLGIRGIRLCLRHTDLFHTQLRAIYRASLVGPIKIMFPMIATIEEFLQAKELAEKVRIEVGAGQVDIGAMIETPAAAVTADMLATEVDFFSIGTNDLAQYTLAMDRMNPELAACIDPLAPSVLRLIDITVRAAKKAGKPVGVCGGIAGDPDAAVILMGLGVDELSMTRSSIPGVKAKIRATSMEQARRKAESALR
ncbi:MAG TPA: phosphoenolpyruvate--protein phosphotransferase [Capsulimonadaceae bacterium]|jgi:phosphocarrier protein FPr